MPGSGVDSYWWPSISMVMAAASRPMVFLRQRMMADASPVLTIFHGTCDASQLGIRGSSDAAIAFMSMAFRPVPMLPSSRFLPKRLKPILVLMNLMRLSDDRYCISLGVSFIDLRCCGP